MMLAFLVVVAPRCLAQLQSSQWYFGGHAAVTFASFAGPRGVSGSALIAHEGSASIADPTSGALLFYTNGATIWDRTHSVMQGGDALGGSDHAAQSALILEHPAGDGVYVVFVADYAEGMGPFGPRGTGVRAVTVDMKANGGLGAVVSRTPQLRGFTTEQLCAVRKEGARGYWILSHENASSSFVVFSLGLDGISGPSIQPSGPVLPTLLGTGAMKPSADGRRLAIANGCVGGDVVQLASFDPRLGLVSAHVPSSLHVGTDAYGVSFSPDGTKLYVTTSAGSCTSDPRLLQFDLISGDSAAVERSRRVVAAGSGFGALQLGPDGRLYVSNYLSRWLGTVQEPDSLAPSCGYDSAAVDLSPGQCRYGLPNIVESDLGLRRVGFDDTTICHGAEVTLRARWIDSPHWSPAHGLSCVDCIQTEARPDTTTTYYLSSNLHSGAPLDSVVVFVEPSPSAVIVGDTVICKGETAEIELITAASIRWEDEGEIGCGDCSRVVLHPGRTTTYRFELTSSAGCTRIDSLAILVLPLPVVAAGPDRTICAGEAVQIGTRGAGHFRWEPADGLSCTECPDPIASPNTTTAYTLSGWNEPKCIARDTMTVTVLSGPTVDAGEDTVICAGSAVRLHATGAETYNWKPALGLSCIDCAEPMASPSRTTTYIVTGVDTNGCSSTDSTVIIVADARSLSLSGDSAICRGSAATLRASGGTAYTWWSDDGAILCVACDSIQIRPARSTTYHVRSEGQCEATDSFEVRVSEPPSVLVTGPDEVCAGDSVLLVASGASRYWWVPSDGLSCSECSTPTASPTSTTTYQVIGEGDFGCRDTIAFVVAVRQPSRAGITMRRDLKLSPGRRGNISTSLDFGIATEALTFEVGWNASVLIVGEPSIAPTLAASGWSAGTTRDGDSRLTLRLVHDSVQIISPGALFTIPVAAVLGDSSGSEIRLAVFGATESCTELHTQDGRVELDSLCGLNWRLMSLSGETLRLSRPVPHPVRDASALKVALPFDGVARLTLIDASGRECIRLLDGYVSGGTHEFVVSSDDLAAGIYRLILSFGDEFRTELVVVAP